MDWKTALADLRAHLPAAGQRGGVQRGSLRWLEGEMQRQGGNPAALRNIIYRDTGTRADKAVLTGILQALARETGRSLELPQAAPTTALSDELELLGRSKKRIYKQFLAGVRAGRSPRLVVWGRAGAGKTVLLGQVAQALEGEGHPVTRLNLSGDVLPPGQIHAQGRSYAALAAMQWEWARRATPTTGTLLVRVTANLNFAGHPPRLPDGSPATPAAWAAQFLKGVPPGVALLLALEDPSGWPDPAGLTELRPPTPTEARTYLMQKLGVTRQAADQLLRETGRHLDRLTLLTGAGGSAAQLLADPEMRLLAAVIAALSTLKGQAGETYPQALLELALGRPLASLPLHVRTQLQGSPEGWRPNLTLIHAQEVLPAPDVTGVIQRLAETPADTAQAAWHLAALAHLGQWVRLTRHLERVPDDARHLPELWPRIRRAAPVTERERLAREVVNHHAGRGEYDSPRARDALFSLLESERDPVRAWARVKLAESSLDHGNFQASGDQIRHADVQAQLKLRSADPWVLAVQSDALLLRAALARWQGDMDTATQAVRDPRIVQSGPRVELWRGLIAKDAGRWPEALIHLQGVPPSSPLLAARARYQEGDLRLRLGQPQAALQALLDAAARLEDAGGTPEELARILARAGTAQRRLGHPGLGLELSRRALKLLPTADRRLDRVLRARLLSEQLPILLALNRPDAALHGAQQALELLDSPNARQAEAQYRARRTHYRVALTYLTRGLGRPYLQPLHGPAQDHPDLVFARQQLDDLLSCPAGDSDREQVLTFDMRLSRALAEPDPRLALEHVRRALDMTDHPYAEAQARATLADAYLRTGSEHDQALIEINRAYSLLRRVQVGLPGTHAADPALHAQLLALEGWATIHQGLPTLSWLRGALADEALRPFQAGVWREVGRALETGHPDPQRLLREWHPEAARLPMRVRDALPLLEGRLSGTPDTLEQ